MTIYVKMKGTKPPNEHHYVLAKNGYFMRKKNPLMDVIMRVNEIPSLEMQKEEAIFKYPKIDKDHIKNIVGFFFKMYKKFGGESIVLIYWNRQNGYLFDAPEQKVSRLSIGYSPQKRHKGYLLVGTIHTHGRAIASHSTGHANSDHEDEKDFDGLHITIGNINAKIITISCSIMVNGRRYILDPLEYIDGITEVKIVKTNPPKTKLLDPNYKEIPDQNKDYYSSYKSKNPLNFQYAVYVRENDNEYFMNYWAPTSGLKHWELLLPLGEKSVKNIDFHYSKKDRFTYRLRKALYGLPKVEEKDALETSVEYLGNPKSNNIPFFFKLNLGDDQVIEDLSFPVDWEKNVSKRPVKELIKMNLKSFLT